MQVWTAQQPIVKCFTALLKTTNLIVIALIFLLSAYQANAQIYYLGVLAPQGETAAQQRWQPWLDGLNKQLKEDTVVLVPLTLENWQQQIEAQQFAFVLGPQVQFIKMDTAGWRWLATLQANTLNKKLDKFKISAVKQSDFKTDAQYKLYKQLENERVQSKQDKADKAINQPNAMEQIAGALWVRADSDIYQLQDLSQRKIAAVNPDAFAGYLLVAHLLQQNGVPPSDYRAQFVGYPIELTLSTLASGAVEAAIAPLCLMEEMAAQGKIEQTQYRLLNPVTTASNCQSSTEIYPNWTLAATREAPSALTEQINQYLFNTDSQNTERSSAVDFDEADNLRWLTPESNSDAERILYEMGQHPAQKSLGSHLIDWIKSHRWWMSVIVFVILISTVNYGWMSWLAWRRRQQIVSQNRLIRDYDQQLRQTEQFAVIGEMSGAIAHEINQPLATIQNYAQGLLIRSQNNKVNKESLEQKSTETALQQIVNETERAAAVIKNIRHWAGRSQPAEVSVDIAATYERCVLLLGDKGADIDFWFASDYQYLRLPNLLLDQLLINSVLNAQQQGATVIMLRCEIEAYEGSEWLVLHITDDAGGFDEAQLIKSNTNNESQPYSSHQQAIRSTKPDGLGLGLMICQRLCKSLNGKMTITNVNTQEELANVQNTHRHHQQHLKLSVASKINIAQASKCVPLTYRTGAQVSFYLPTAFILR